MAKTICTFIFLLTSSISIIAQYNLGVDSTFYTKIINSGEAYIEQNAISKAKEKFEAVYQLAIKNKNGAAEALALIKLNEVAIEEEDFKSKINTVDRIFEIGAEKKNRFIQGVALLQKAQYAMYKNQRIEADKLFEKAIKYLPGYHSQTALAWNDRGYNANLFSQYNNAAEYYLTALGIYEKLNDESGMAMTFNNLSALQYDLKEIAKAIEYSKKAITIREQLKDYSRLANSYCNLSQLYLTVDVKEADRYAKLCKTIADKTGKESLQLYALNTIGLVKNYSGEKYEWLESALHILNVLKSKDSLSALTGRQYLSIGIGMYNASMDSTTTVQYLNKAIEISLINNDKETLRDAYGNSNVFFRLHNDFNKAYSFLRKYHHLKDSLINEKTVANVAELQTKYETEKKDFEIDRLNVEQNRLYAEQKLRELKIKQLNTDQQLKQLAIEKQNALIAGNNALAKKKENEIELLSQQRAIQELQIKQATEALEKQSLLAKTQEQQLSIAEKEKQLNASILNNQKNLRNIIIGLAAVLLALAGFLFNRYKLKKKIKEQENLLAVRDSIAKDLHDDVGSTLSSIKILSEVSFKNINKDNNKVALLLEKIITQSEDMQHGISDIVWAVKPQNDKIENILEKVKEYVNRTLEPKGISTTFKTSSDIMLTNIAMPQRRNFLLICREAINNIAKYSECQSVAIDIETEKEKITVIIKDNGKGFVKAIAKLGNGLKNMEARAKAMRGVLNIDSEIGKGTTVKLVFPSTI